MEYLPTFLSHKDNFCDGQEASEVLNQYYRVDLWVVLPCRFKNVTLFSPDGSMLVRELSFEVLTGQSVIIMGPNGRCGCLFRLVLLIRQREGHVQLAKAHALKLMTISKCHDDRCILFLCPRLGRE